MLVPFLPPKMPSKKLPSKEREAVRMLYTNLATLGVFCGMLNDAVSLVDMCDKKRREFKAKKDPALAGKMKQLERWMILAGRDGALTIWNFGETQQQNNKIIGRVPIVLKHRDRAAHAEAGRLFEQHFKDYAKVRLAVAHMGDIAATPEKIEKQARWDIRPEEEAPFFSGCMRGRYFYSTIEGEIVGYHLTPETVENLVSVLRAIYRSYEPVEAILEQIQNALPPPADRSVHP